jgi:hypothetical protein
LFSLFEWRLFAYLKVLSSEMDPAESMLLWQVFIEETGAGVLGKIRPSPIL